MLTSWLLRRDDGASDRNDAGRIGPDRARIADSSEAGPSALDRSDYALSGVGLVRDLIAG
jgi:hypothetical protein